MSGAYERVYDPRGQVDAERIAPAPRAATLDGLRLGILDNTKWNANRLLRKTADRLGEQHRFAVFITTRRKASRRTRIRRSSRRSLPRTTSS
jgi:hypothetical protein